MGLDHPSLRRATSSRQSINDLLSDLEKRGYLERTPDPMDGRARIVRFTKRGWDLTQVLSDMSFATESEWARVVRGTLRRVP
jgi:DNA-binding MarR family transcriptional regulator